MHGQFVGYELMTSDLAAARKFYPQVTGWGTEDWDRSTYVMWTAAGIPLGGIVQLRQDQLAQGMPTSWMPYIEASDVDTSAKRAASLGGRVLFGPQDVPGTGRFAVVSDPQGALFAIYKSLSPSEGYDGDPIPGRFSWHELTTTDAVAAFDFYRQLFGWERTGDFDMGPPVGKYQMYGMKGKQFGGMFNRTPEMGNTPPFWLCYINVPDVRKATKAATKAGATLINGPMEVPGGDWIAVLHDPQGAMFAVHQVPPAAADRPARKGAKSAKAKKARPARANSAAKKASRKAPKKTTKKPARSAARKASRKPAKKKSAGKARRRKR